MIKLVLKYTQQLLLKLTALIKLTVQWYIILYSTTCSRKKTKRFWCFGHSKILIWRANKKPNNKKSETGLREVMK